MPIKKIKVSKNGYDVNDFAIKKSRNGKGLFARRDFGVGEILLEVKGDLVECNVDDEMDETVRDNTYRFNRQKYISPTEKIGNLLNHSCQPNARIMKRKGKLFVQSYLPIKKGQEILFDYSTLIAKDDIWEMKCNCGSQKCRGLIKRFSSLPQKIKKDYIASALVPKYILNI